MIQKVTLLIFCFFITTGIKAQGIVTKADLIGSWKIVKVEIKGVVIAEGENLIFTESYFSDFSESLTKSFKNAFGLVAQMALNTERTFAKDGTFSQTYPSGEKLKGKYKLTGTMLTLYYDDRTTQESRVSKKSNQLILSLKDRRDEEIIYTSNKI